MPGVFHRRPAPIVGRPWLFWMTTRQRRSRLGSAPSAEKNCCRKRIGVRIAKHPSKNCTSCGAPPGKRPSPGFARHAVKNFSREKPPAHAAKSLWRNISISKRKSGNRPVLAAATFAVRNSFPRRPPARSVKCPFEWPALSGKKFSPQLAGPRNRYGTV